MWIPVEDEAKCGFFVIRVETVSLLGESVCLVIGLLGDRFVRPVGRSIQRIGLETGLESGKGKHQPNS